MHRAESHYAGFSVYRAKVCRSGLLVEASARELTFVVELLSDLPDSL
jgi:hypothetical protein